MKSRVHSYLVPCIALSAALLFIGCGGGGGGGGGGSGSTGTNATTGGRGEGSQFAYSTRVIEFNGLNRANGYLDPLNLQVGDRIQLELNAYDGIGGSSGITNVSWGLIGGGGAVTLTSDGVLEINGQPSGFFQVTCDAVIAGQQQSFEADCLVPTSTTTISGRVVELSSGLGVAFIQIEFINSVGDRIGGARTSFNGTFIGETPAGAAGVTADGETIQIPLFYRSLRFQGENYTGGRSCPIPLGTINAGQNNPMPGNISLTLQQSGPPPPPTGCS